MISTSQSDTLEFSARGKATRNQVARQVSGADAIEVKAIIPDRQINKALRRLGLTIDNGEERFIYFFDTRRRHLMAQGIIARARRVFGNRHDSTVKFRPVEPHELPGRWHRTSGFKLEADASEKGVVRSASLTLPVEKGLIKRVIAGERPIRSLFSRRQESFLMAMGGETIDFTTLTVFGPLRAYRWDLDEPRCPWPLTVELWRRADGERLLETSIKAPAAQAAFAISGFMGLLAEFGVERDAREQTKTRWALMEPASDQ